jgi:serine/threonine protein kinase
MGTVWIADDSVLSRRVAVKVLRADLAADDATRARFRNEALAAARLSHPNIVAIYDTGGDSDVAYIVMELVNGPTVRALLDERGPLPVRDAVRIALQVADALDAAHRAGLVHRDVKPANVLVPAGGPVKVTDFGIAKVTGSGDLTRTGTVMGTARYLAPEQVTGGRADSRTDVYALGLLLYEMLCAQPPFRGDTDVATATARLTSVAPSIRPQRPDVPAALDDVVHRCLARDPARRFPTARDFRAALIAVPPNAPAPRSGTAPATGPASPRPTPRPTARPAPRPASAPRPARGSGTGPAGRRKRRGSAATWVWVVVVFLLAIAAGVTAYLLLRDQGSGGGATPNVPASARVIEPPEAPLA